MAQQVIDIGTSASDGTGDPLRDAFTKINDNFGELYGTVENEGLTYGNVSSNVAGITFNITRYTENYSASPVLRGTGQAVGNVYVIRGNVLGGTTPINDVYLTVTTLANVIVGNVATVSAAGVPVAPVLRVNGLTGNVTLTVNNIDGAASRAYVNAAIAANVANVTGTVTDSLNANITAANAVISNHAARITTLESNAATQAAAIVSLNSTKASISYVDTSIDLALSSNAILANVVSVNANVAAANAAILLRANLSGATFTGNIQAGNITAVARTYTESLVVGTRAVPDFYVDKGGAFVGDNADFFGVLVQNQRPSSTGALVVWSETPNLTRENFVAIGIAGNSYVNPRYPKQLPEDSYVYAVGGNLYLESETHAVQTITANVVRMEVQNSGTVKIFSNLQFADGTLQSTAFGGNIDISTTNANVTAANIAISNLQSNAAAQTLELNALVSNSGVQAETINTLTANAAQQSVAINSINANVGSYQLFANSNSAAQALMISSLDAGITAVNLNVATLTINAASQSQELNNLQSNAQSQQSIIINLQGNASTQAIAIDGLTANLTAANNTISLLSSNAITQATQINFLNSNLSAANVNIVNLTSNAATQALDINNLYANINFYLANVSSATANIEAANIRIITIDANLGSTVTNVSALQSNAVFQATQINALNANVTAANIIIDTKASYIDGNLQANYFIANANVKIESTLEVGNLNQIDYPGLGGVFVGNSSSYYQVVVQNLNNGAGASGDFVITADDGSDTDKYLNIGINSSSFAGNFIVPAGDTGLTEYPYDGYLNVIGGNAIVRSDGNVYLAANTTVVGLVKDGNFTLINCDLVFSDGSTQTSANINSMSYTPNNAANYNGTVTNVQQALDQLAARLRALGG